MIFNKYLLKLEVRMKKKRIIFFLPLFLFLYFVFSYPSKLTVENLLEEMFSVPSPTGYEEPMVEKIIKLLPQEYTTERDNMGSLYLHLGKREPQLTLLSGMDEIGYVVSGLNPEGYLLLDRVVPSPHPLFDSYHLGHPMVVWTEKGALPGVLAIPSVHILSRERRQELQQFSLDSAYIDIGASSEKEAKMRGVRILDAVTAWPELSRLAGEKRAGFSLGNKTCCALLLSLARELDEKKISQKTTFVWMAQTKFLARASRPRPAMGALRVKRKLNPELVLIIDVVPVEGGGETGILLGKGPVLVYPKKEKAGLKKRIEGIAKREGISLQYYPEFGSSLMNPFLSGSGEVLTLALPIKYSSTPVEVVDFKDVRALKKLLSILVE